MPNRVAVTALALLIPFAASRSAAAQAVPTTSTTNEPARAVPPPLERVVALAQEQAPAVVVARAEVDVGRSAYVGARLGALANPYLEVIADRGTGGATKDVTVQGQLFIPVEIGGQRGRRIAEADALVAWQEADVVVWRASAAGDAVRAYGAMVVAAARMSTFQALVTVARSEADVYEARLAAGDATEQDAKLAKVEVARNAVVLAESRADLVRALGELYRLIGIRFAEPVGLDPEPPPPRNQEPVAAAAAAPMVKAKELEAVFHARAIERQARDAQSPLNLIVTGGRGDLGEARFGGGLGWALPVSRRNQGEQARAAASRVRAIVERDVRARVIAATLEGLAAERTEVRRALTELTEVAEPAAQASVDAAAATQRAGKSELLKVLTARRDLALLKARRLDLLQREWSILSDIATLTGGLP